MADSIADVKSIFGRALEMGSAAECDAYLAEACGGDERLRAEIESLLQAKQDAGGFLAGKEQPAPAVAVDEPAVTEGPGTVIGHYKLLEEIGEGGFGVVFMAEQQQPVRRKVALKILKPGMDTRQIIARFEAERQALALMEHPNIAQVFDGGTTSGEPGGLGSGRPFFVMELVNGIPITDYCDENELATRRRLELFLSVCHAVQHAHQKGIIHRDLKPSNILVTRHDGTPVVKVIDFGIAKAMSQQLTDKTLFTNFAQLLGTPLYLSPEQAALSGLDVDTRTDIYSLGVVLYELLTGTTPFDKQRFKEVDYDEMRRIIREEEPPKPSTRFLKDDGTRMKNETKRTKRTRVDWSAPFSSLILHPSSFHELDWIVMKCLEKDRIRRYETANALVLDVQRYLAGEPVAACPPSVGYRLRKFVQRHRAAALTAVVVAAALLTGTTVAIWQAVVATQAKHDALAAASAAKAAQETAEAKEAETQAVLEFVENRVFAAARPRGQAGGLGRDVTLPQALEAALPVVDRSFANQPLVGARLRMTLGSSFWMLGYPKIAADQFHRARAIYTQLLGPDDTNSLESTNRLATSYMALGRQTEAARLYEETLAVRKVMLGPNHAETLRSMNNLALSYTALGRFADAVKLHEETFALRKVKLGPDDLDTLHSMNNLASSYHDLGRHVDALTLHEEALALCKAKLGPDHPETLKSMNNLANSYAALGRRDDALELSEQTLALQEAKLGLDHPDTLATMHNLATSYVAAARYADALKLQQQTLALRKLRFEPDHPDTLKNMNNVANSYARLGRYADAVKLHQETLSRRRAALGPDHPDTLNSMWRVAATLIELNRGAEAVPLLDECLRRASGKIVAPGLVAGVADLRLRHFEKAMDAAGCRATAQMWEELQRNDTDSLYNAACYRAVTAAVLRTSSSSSDTAKQADAEADRAMDWLRQAVAAGFKNGDQMKKDHDFDGLRDRPDFKKLLADLETGATKGP